MPRLETRNLTVRFGGLTAIDDLSLSVEGGELLCLLGPNGAGKSTLLDLICGRTARTSGEILFEGRDVGDQPEYRRARGGIGRKFQIPSVFRSLTVSENIDIARVGDRDLTQALARVAGGGGQRTAALLEKIGLAELADEPAENLSHGQTQWLEIAMLLAQDCKVLLMDEPTAGMTAGETAETARMLQELGGERTIVVVEHDMTFVRKIAERIVVLHQGAMLAEGNVAEIERNADVRSAYLGH